MGCFGSGSPRYTRILLAFEKGSKVLGDEAPVASTPGLNYVPVYRGVSLALSDE